MIFDREPGSEVDSPSKDVDAVCEESPGAKLLEPWAARRVKITLNQFSFFAVVAKHSSVTKASAELRVSQPSITQQLKRLEDYHGARLYRRTSKGIEITAAGWLFLHKITPILAQVSELQRGSKFAPQPVRNLLSVGGTFSASAVLLPKLLARLQARHPNTELEFQTSASEHLERLVVKGATDLALINRRPAAKELTCESLGREKLLFFVHANHRLAGQKTLKMSNVLAEPLIIRGGKGISGTTERALKRLQEQGWAVRVGMRCEGPAGIIALVRQKMGVGIAFEDSIKAESDAGEFKVLDVPGLKIEAESFILYLKNRALSPLAREFLDLLRGERARPEKLQQASRCAISARGRGESAIVTRPVAAP